MDPAKTLKKYWTGNIFKFWIEEGEQKTHRWELFFEKIPRSHAIEPIIVENIEKILIWLEIKMLSPYLGAQKYFTTVI